LLYDGNRHQIASPKESLVNRPAVPAARDDGVLQAEQAYWELSYAYNNLQVQLDAVRIGIQQDESNRGRKTGPSCAIDVVAAQTQLATFEVGAYGGASR